MSDTLRLACGDVFLYSSPPYLTGQDSSTFRKGTNFLSLRLTLKLAESDVLV